MPTPSFPLTLHEAECRTAAENEMALALASSASATISTRSTPPQSRLNRFERGGAADESPSLMRASRAGNAAGSKVMPKVHYPPTSPAEPADPVHALGEGVNAMTLCTHLGKVAKERYEQEFLDKFGPEIAAQVIPPSQGDIGFDILSDQEQVDLEFPPVRPINKRKRASELPGQPNGDNKENLDADTNDAEVEIEMDANKRSAKGKGKVPTAAAGSRSASGSAIRPRTPLAELVKAAGDDDVLM